MNKLFGRLTLLIVFIASSNAFAADPGILYLDVFTGLQGYQNVSGVTADINLGPKYTIGVDYAPSNRSNFSESMTDILDFNNGFSVTSGRIVRSMQGAHLRVYPKGGSFHLTILAGQASTKVNATIHAEANGEIVKYSARRDQNYVGMTIGNDFRFSNFVFGFEWVGYIQSLNNKTVYSTPEATDPDLIEGISAADDYTDRASIGGVSLLWLKIGFGF